MCRHTFAQNLIWTSIANLLNNLSKQRHGLHWSEVINEHAHYTNVKFLEGVVVNLNQVTLPVKDMTEAVTFYQTLGFILIVDTPHYSRFECPAGDSTFSLSLRGDDFSNGAVIYFEHEELDSWVETLIAKGIVFEELPTDQRYLWREAELKDPSGNRVILYWAGENRRNPPWRVTGELNKPL